MKQYIPLLEVRFTWNDEDVSSKNGVKPPKEWFSGLNTNIGESDDDLKSLKGEVASLLDRVDLYEIFNCVYKNYIEDLKGDLYLSDDSIQRVMYIFTRDYYNSDTFISFLKKFFLLERSSNLGNYDDLSNLEQEFYKKIQLRGEYEFYKKFKECVKNT